MEALLLIIAVIIVILLVTLRSDLKGHQRLLERRMDDLEKTIKLIAGVKVVPDARKEAEGKRVVDIPAYRPPVIPDDLKEKEGVAAAQEPTPQVVPVAESPIAPVNIPPVAREPKPSRPGFFERNPDLEKFIGENLANKIGIGILVLGIGFFVKYAIDQDWINEIGRVFIGILCGGLLLGAAHYLRKTFTAFSSVLVGGGIAVLYLTIAIAFHEYHLFSQTAAFLVMVVITGFAVLFSLAYNRIELAVVSLLGGFASPFMVSTGEGNYVILFTYVLVLDLGMLVLAYHKKWNLINIISFAGTIILFGSWVTMRFQFDKAWMLVGGLSFATAFYLTFFIMNMVNNLRKRVAFGSLEIAILLSNTFLYYAAGMFLLDNPLGHAYQGLFTAALALFNFIFAFSLYRSDRVDKKVVYLLIGLVLTFTSLAAPVQLEGNYITMFWAAEAVLLLWLSQKSGIRMMKLTSIVVSALMLISLAMDWNQLYHIQEAPLRILLNKGYITSLFSLLSLAGCIYLTRFEKTEKPESVRIYKEALIVAATIVLYTSQLLELKYHLNLYFEDTATRNMIVGTYNMFFISGILWASRKWASADLRTGLVVFGVLGIGSYLFFYHEMSISARDGYLTGAISGTGFFFHYALLAGAILVSILSLTIIQEMEAFNRKTGNLYGWVFVFLFVFMASAELDHLVVSVGYSEPDSIDNLLTQNHKIGYPILWGVTSFLLIAAGMKWKKRHLRIISLTLFLVTLVKLFTVDIVGISEGGKIAAFISLGLLLLVVSFMYQRLKKLLLRDETEINTNQP